jgi:hypothetical protein
MSSPPLAAISSAIASRLRSDDAGTFAEPMRASA